VNAIEQAAIERMRARNRTAWQQALTAHRADSDGGIDLPLYIPPMIAAKMRTAWAREEWPAMVLDAIETTLAGEVGAHPPPKEDPEGEGAPEGRGDSILADGQTFDGGAYRCADGGAVRLDERSPEAHKRFKSWATEVGRRPF